MIQSSLTRSDLHSVYTIVDRRLWEMENPEDFEREAGEPVDRFDTVDGQQEVSALLGLRDHLNALLHVDPAKSG